MLGTQDHSSAGISLKQFLCTSEILSAYIKTYKYILTDVGFNIHTVPQHVFIT